MDHSCCPNANVSFDGRNILIRALKDFNGHSCDQHCQVKGSIDLANEVKISYIDVMEHTLVRQRKLEDQYYFKCKQIADFFRM